MSFKKGLLRPFIDFERCSRGPLFSRGFEGYWAAFANPELPRFALQRTLPAPFRRILLRELGEADLIVEDPRSLPQDTRGERCTALIEALDRWQDLSSAAQSRLVLLLHALCYYELVLRLVPAQDNQIVLHDADQVELIYWRASSHYVLNLKGRVDAYQDADLSVFVHLAQHPEVPKLTAFNSAIKILTHKAKTGASLEELVAWRSRAHALVEALQAEMEADKGALLESRFYRSASFVPQLQKDVESVVREMDLAEELALSLSPGNETEQLLADENLHPVLESRTKEAIWLGDLDLALERANRVVELDPFESRAWLELGQVRIKRAEWGHAAEAYVRSMTLGPPSSAIAAHMAGLCFRHLGQPSTAAFFFQASLGFDPASPSPHHEIESLPDDAVFTALKDWSLRSALY